MVQLLAFRDWADERKVSNPVGEHLAAVADANPPVPILIAAPGEHPAPVLIHPHLAEEPRQR
jgi:hypothetical protein